MREEKYSCPDIDCAFTHYEGGDCPYCGKQLEKIRGEEMPPSDDFEKEPSAMPPVTNFDDDPDLWYVDDREPLETM